MTVSEELQQLIDNPATDASVRVTLEKALATMKAMADQITRQQETAAKYGRKVNQHNEAMMAVLLGLNHLLAINDPEITDQGTMDAGEQAVTAAGGTVGMLRQLIGQIHAMAAGG